MVKFVVTKIIVVPDFKTFLLHQLLPIICNETVCSISFYAVAFSLV